MDTIQQMSLNEFATFVYKLVNVAKAENPFSVISEVKDLKFDFAAFAEPIIKKISNMDVYELAAKIKDLVKPTYIEEGKLTEFADKDYYTYDDDYEKYNKVDLTVTTTPDPDETYYTKKITTEEEIKVLINDFIATAEEKFALEIVSDNEANLKNIKLSLDYEMISGEITIDFEQDYSDELKATLATYKKFAQDVDTQSTRVFEEVLTDTVFDGFKYNDEDVTIIKENGKNIGIKIGENNSYFGTNETDEDHYYSDKKFLFEKYMMYSVSLYCGDNSYSELTFIYDTETNKFVTGKEELYKIYDLYVFDYDKNDYVSAFSEVNKAEGVISGESYYICDERGVYIFLPVDKFEDDVTYYTKAQPSGDSNHPFIIKTVNRFTKKVGYYVYYYAEARQ